MGPTLQDSKWVRHAFLVSAKDMTNIEQKNRVFTTVSLQFVDTSPGGNLCINPPPQYTIFADPPPRGGTRSMGSDGLSRYYGEAINENNQIIYCRMGVPKFNSLTTFFAGFYDPVGGRIARTGRAPGVFYTLGKAAGFVVTVMNWKLLAVTLIGYVGQAGRFFMDMPSSKFYYSKPNMPNYWQAVQTIVNHIAVNKGIVPRLWSSDSEGQAGQQFSGGYIFDDAAKKKMKAMFPDIFTSGGSVNVYALANKAQRIARKHDKMMEEIANSDDKNFISRLVTASKSKIGDPGTPGYQAYLKKYLESAQGKPSDAVGTGGAGTISTTTENEKKTPEAYNGFFDFLKAELDDGSAFASFRVNATGPISESFSNTVTESELSSKMNSMASQSRSTSFNFANGNLMGGVAGEMLGSAFGAVKDFGAGLLDSVNMSGLAALGGAAFVDIPKHWESSAASLPRSTYTINLISPYGNSISQLLNIYIPLAMLLAMALPISTGRQSYTSPFLIEYYDKGRCQSRLAMVDSLQITRGTGSTGFNNLGQALAMDVTFSFVDMSSILHMPLSQGFGWNNARSGANLGGVLGAGVGGVTGAVTGGAGGAAAGAAAAGAAGTAAGAGIGGAMDVGAAVADTIKGVFDGDNPFSDYMAVLGSQSLADQIYPLRKMKLNLTRAIANWDTFLSPAAMASFAGDTMAGRFMSAFYKGINR